MKKLIININKIKIGLLMGLILTMPSCVKTNENPDFIVDADVSITSFIAQGVEGEIDQKTGEILVRLPYGSKVSAIIPEIGLPNGAVIEPAIDEPINFSKAVDFTVINGNIFKTYKVTVQVEKPILKFSINGVNGAIDHVSKKINIILSGETDVTELKPEIVLSSGVSISPASGETVDFTNPVGFTVKAGDHQEDYTVTVTRRGTGLKVAYLGLAESRSAINDLDEKAAGDWLFNTFSDATYISFDDIMDGAALEDYATIWWHYDEAQELPAKAKNQAVVNALKAYRAGGGNLLLTTFAAQYVETLGVVPAGKGPNNVFGDFPPHGGVDEDNSWGISFKGREDHPLYEGIETYEDGKAYFLEKGTFRLNHTAWWFLPEWGGYENGANWRSQTGGINLASEAWDDHLDGRVAIAEFPGSEEDGNVIVIAFGAYDWYNEMDNDNKPSKPNGFLPNIERLTENAIKYLGSN